MHLKFGQGREGLWEKEILNLCYNRDFCYSGILVASLAAFSV